MVIFFLTRNVLKRVNMHNQISNILVLGSGTSTGVPLVGCSCSVCKSQNPKNKRLRSSLLLTTLNQKKILIDSTPDLRTQLLNNQISNIDALILTHEHADHLHGIDDIRPLSFKHKKTHIPIYMSQHTFTDVSARFPYIFKSDQLFTKNRPILGGGIPNIDSHPINIVEEGETVPTSIFNEEFIFFKVPHGYTYTMGTIYNKFCYIADCNFIDERIISFLKNLKLNLLIIDCVQKHPHNTHLIVDKTFNYIKEIAPKSAGLIHMSHHLDHNWLEKETKKYFDYPVFPLYDMQTLQYR